MYLKLLIIPSIFVTIVYISWGKHEAVKVSLFFIIPFLGVFLIIYFLHYLALFYKYCLSYISIRYSNYRNSQKICNHGIKGGVYYGSCKECIKEEQNRVNKAELEFQKRQKWYAEERLKTFIKNRIIENEKDIRSKMQPIFLKDLEYLRNLSPTEFEHVVAGIYEKLGFSTTVTPQSNDGGKDIIMRKNNLLYLVECKKYADSNLVSRVELQKLFAAVTESKAHKGFFVTTSDFTKTSKEYPKLIENKIKLINGAKLLTLIGEAYPATFISTKYNEVCTQCGEYVQFEYPSDKIKNCINGHQVNSTIEVILKRV
jgi:restriction system protein